LAHQYLLKKSKPLYVGISPKPHRSLRPVRFHNSISISRFITLTPALSQRAREYLVSPLQWERGGGEGN